MCLTHPVDEQNVIHTLMPLTGTFWTPPSPPPPPSTHTRKERRGRGRAGEKVNHLLIIQSIFIRKHGHRKAELHAQKQKQKNKQKTVFTLTSLKPAPETFTVGVLSLPAQPAEEASLTTRRYRRQLSPIYLRGKLTTECF